MRGRQGHKPQPATLGARSDAAVPTGLACSAMNNSSTLPPPRSDASAHSDAVLGARDLLAAGCNRGREQVVIDLRKVMKLNRHHSLFKQGRLAESLAEHPGG